MFLVFCPIMDIKQNIGQISRSIEAACKRAGRNPKDIAIVAATKTRSIDEIKQAISCGIKIIGENIVQEAEAKFGMLPKVEKHMIGHLQTNKVRKAVELFDCIQSVDSLKLAREIDKRALDAGKVMPVFIEINTAKEESKFGIGMEEAESFYDQLLKLTSLRVQGIMSVLPDIEPEQTRPYFKALCSICKKLNLKYISAGMSNDYIVAVEEGSNMLRLGTAIFGPRK
jgi:pyridoxal phosphate enzyme (YggS family)